MITPRLNVSVAGVILFLFLFLRPAASLQVTAGSPCASSCVGAPHLSPSSSYGLSCKDQDFVSKYNGQLFQSFLTCLQESSFSKGDETDQQWFLYHLRYIFDSCLFDHLDDQGETLGSCMEDNPCDGLDVVLKSGTNDPTSKSPDGYCAVDGSTDLSHSVETCLRCVQSSGSHKYLSNFLVAIKTGCENQPSPGSLLGLSDSVFSETLIQDASQSDKGKLKPAAIAGIVIGIVAFLLLISSCVFFFMRRRQRSPPPAGHHSFPSVARPASLHAPHGSPASSQPRRGRWSSIIRGNTSTPEPLSAQTLSPPSGTPSNWYTTPTSSTTTLVSPPPTAHFASGLTRSPEQEQPHPRSGSSSISSISVSSTAPLIRARTDSAEPPSTQAWTAAHPPASSLGSPSQPRGHRPVHRTKGRPEVPLQHSEGLLLPALGPAPRMVQRCGTRGGDSACRRRRLGRGEVQPDRAALRVQPLPGFAAPAASLATLS
uniref:Transmembrane protein n=1 Tax=Bionectria ochroleuca TaxID=29856 RepID=A0A8H7NG00_BIOOC